MQTVKGGIKPGAAERGWINHSKELREGVSRGGGGKAYSASWRTKEMKHYILTLYRDRHGGPGVGNGLSAKEKAKKLCALEKKRL